MAAARKPRSGSSAEEAPTPSVEGPEGGAEAQKASPRRASAGSRGVSVKVLASVLTYPLADGGTGVAAQGDVVTVESSVADRLVSRGAVVSV